MKNILVLIFACLVGASVAQVYCPAAPGELEIPSSTCCGGANGVTGLALFLREYFLLMQLDCMLDIFFDALLFDDEVLDFYIYVSGPEFEQLCIEIQEMPEWKELLEYFCFELDFDPYLYLNTMGSLLNIRHMTHPQNCVFEFPLPWNAREKADQTLIGKGSQPMSSARSWPVGDNGIGGVSGLIDVLYYEIPHDKGSALWDAHIAKDDALCRAVRAMNTTYFKYMVLRIEQKPEYIRFYMKLNEWGVNFTTFTDELKAFLWDTPHCP